MLLSKLPFILMFFSFSVHALQEVDLEAMKAQNAKTLMGYDKSAQIKYEQNVVVPEKLPNQSTTSKIDIGSMVEKFNQAQKGEEKRKAGLYAFVSLSVPERDLKAIGREIRKAGGTVVLRGFSKDTSVKKTVDALQTINKEVGAQWSIDPDLFKALDIQKVPAIAIVIPKENQTNVTGCSNGNECEPVFDSAIAYGDISVEEAMNRIVLSSTQKTIKDEARSVIARLRN